MSETKIEMTESELEKLVGRVVDETLLRLGVDASDPIAVQQDFAHLRLLRHTAATMAEDLRFARELREGSAAARRSLFMLVGGAIVTFFGTIVYLGWQSFNGR